MAKTLISWLGFLCLAGPLWGQFQAPQALPQTPSGPIDDVQFEVSSFNEVQVLLESNGNLFYTSSLLSFAQFLAVGASSQSQSHAALASGGGASVTVVYEIAQPTGIDIARSTNPGGGFQPAANVTFDAVPDGNPDVAVLATGQRDITWDTELLPGIRQVSVRRESGTTQPLATGRNPRITHSGPGQTFIAYLRNGDVFGLRYNGGTLVSPEIPIMTLPGVESDVRLRGDASGTLHVLVLVGDQLYYTFDAGAGFILPVLVADTVDGAGDLAVSPGGQVHVTYTASGVGYLTSGTGAAFQTPVLIADPGITMTDPQVGVDSNGYLHVIFRSSGDFFYTNDVPPPAVDFSGAPVTGELPLVVQFDNDSTGVVTSWEWNFGDGSTSAAFQPTHTYQQPGFFTVRLIARGPGGMGILVRSTYITVTSPTNVLAMPAINVYPGETGVVHPLLATHADPIQGFQVFVSYDPAVVTPVAVDLDNTLVEPFAPDVFLPGIDLVAHAMSAVVVLETGTPILGLVLPPGDRYRLINVVYDVLPGVAIGTTSVLELPATLPPPFGNVFTLIGAVSALPHRVHGQLSVVAPATEFLRGDVNATASVDIADAIGVLGYLFSGQPLSSCFDAADTNDSGAVDIADAIRILGYLFGDDPAPEYPFPASGLDPTQDTLPGC